MTMYKTIYFIGLGIVCSISLTSSYGIKRYPSNRMLDFNWPEPDEHIKNFPHEKYCHYYYQHESDESFTVRKCPTGEMFDYHVHECKEKHAAQCWSHHYGKHAVHDHIHSKWRKNFKCPFPNGNYPDIFDCDKYIVCLDGNPYHKHCSPNQQFDKIRRHCVYVAVCANSTDAALVTHMCPYSSGKFAHREDCSKYYNCHKGEPTVMTCEKNQLFHEEDRECKDEALVICKDRPNPLKKMSASESAIKFVAVDSFSSSISSINFGTNTEGIQTSDSSKSSSTAADYSESTTPSVISQKASSKAKTDSPGKTEKLQSAANSSSTDQAVNQSQVTNHSVLSTVTAGSTENTVASGSSKSSNTSESIGQSETTNDSLESSTIGVNSSTTAGVTLH